jgi:hypothetical protein
MFKKNSRWQDYIKKIHYWWQRRTRGWDDTETYSLDYSLAKLIIPRLKRFKELKGGCPGDLTYEEWDQQLDKMIFAFEFLGSDERWGCYDEEIWDRVAQGLKLFYKRYMNLWW